MGNSSCFELFPRLTDQLHDDGGEGKHLVVEVRIVRLAPAGQSVAVLAMRAATSKTGNDNAGEDDFTRW